MTRILVTSALPYINGVKHLGTLAGSMLPADIYARFERQRHGRDNVLCICATDEHGTPAELAALDEGVPVAEYCAKWHDIQADLVARFGLDFDYFGRSSSAQNRALTQSFARTLWEAGYLEERTTKQVYSPSDGRFLPDRYVVGTCPHCGYENARGDQCESCTRVLDPADLIDPHSALSGATNIDIRDSKHLFLRQSAFIDRLRQWIETKKRDWPLLVTSIALKWLDEGLQDRGITRDLDWGVPVNAQEWGANPSGQMPDVEGLKGKVFYVWFDAPIEYIGATWEWADAQARAQGKPASTSADWQRWWKGEAAEDVTYVQFMGKDNVPFHTVGFPCTLIGVNEREPEKAHWKLVDALKGFNWLNYYGGKFSTSLKRGVFMDHALELLPADYWRWYLMTNAPEGSDASFTWTHFAQTVNKDLADVLGNFVNRILKFTASRFDAQVPESGEPGPEELALFDALDKRISAYGKFMQACEFRKSVAELRAIWVIGNEYVTHAAPWQRIKTDRTRAGLAVRYGVNLVHLFAHLSWPFIPETARRMHESLLPAPPVIPWPQEPAAAFLRIVAPGQSISVPDVLFQKIDDEQVKAWEARFGGLIADT